MPFEYEYVDTLDDLIDDIDDQHLDLGLDGDVGIHPVESDDAAQPVES
jgi:hypothetical protein